MNQRDLAQRLAVEATEIFNCKDANFTEITGMIEKHKHNKIKIDDAYHKNGKEYFI